MTKKEWPDKITIYSSEFMEGELLSFIEPVTEWFSEEYVRVGKVDKPKKKPERLSDRAERRWTIPICSGCGEVYPTTSLRRDLRQLHVDSPVLGEGCGSYVEEVEVVPLTELEAVEADRDHYFYRLEWEDEESKQLEAALERAEQAEKQLEAVEAERDEIQSDAFKWKERAKIGEGDRDRERDRAEQAEKELEKERYAWNDLLVKERKQLEELREHD